MRVIIVDDDRLVCQSLKTILEVNNNIEVIGVGHDGEQAITLCTKLQPDVLLMDIRMESTSGLVACERILEQFPEMRILFLTTFLDDEYIVRALRLGAKGYTLKQNFESIIPALKAVHMGQSVFGDEIMLKLPSLLHSKEPQDLAAYGISDKEVAIVRLVAQGLSNREIADTLYLSEGTVRNYISVILEKLQLRDRTQLAVFYLSRGGQGTGFSPAD